MSNHLTYIEWTRDALEQDDDAASMTASRVSMKPRVPGVITDVDSSNGVFNWAPSNAIDSIIQAQDPKKQYITVVMETIENFQKWARAETASRDEPLELPEIADHYEISPMWLAAEAYDMADRLVKGSLHEMIGREHLAESFRVLETAEAVKAHPEAEDAEELENAEVDVVTGTIEDPTFWQIKSSESKAQQVEADVNILVVDDGEVTRYD